MEPTNAAVVERPKRVTIASLPWEWRDRITFTTDVQLASLSGGIVAMIKRDVRYDRAEQRTLNDVREPADGFCLHNQNIRPTCHDFVRSDLAMARGLEHIRSPIYLVSTGVYQSLLRQTIAFLAVQTARLTNHWVKDQPYDPVRISETG